MGRTIGACKLPSRSRALWQSGGRCSAECSFAEVLRVQGSPTPRSCETQRSLLALVGARLRRCCLCRAARRCAHARPYAACLLLWVLLCGGGARDPAQLACQEKTCDACL